MSAKWVWECEGCGARFETAPGALPPLEHQRPVPIAFWGSLETVECTETVLRLIGRSDGRC